MKTKESQFATQRLSQRTAMQKGGALPRWKVSREVICFPVTPLRYQAAPLAIQGGLLYNSKQFPSNELVISCCNKLFHFMYKLTCTTDHKQQSASQVDQKLCKPWEKDRAESPKHSKYYGLENNRRQ